MVRAKSPNAVRVGIDLEVLSILDIFGVNIPEIDGRIGDAPGVNVGLRRQWGFRAVVVDIEASDAMVIVVVNEEFGHVDGLILDHHAEGHPFCSVRRRQRRIHRGSWLGIYWAQRGLNGDLLCREGLDWFARPDMARCCIGVRGYDQDRGYLLDLLWWRQKQQEGEYEDD